MGVNLDAPKFTRGETFYNGSPIDTNDIGAATLLGRVYQFEPTSPNAQDNPDSSGRPVKCRVVRNTSGQALKPGLLVMYDPSDPYETRVNKYTNAVGDRPAGVVDEYLPAAGVPNNDTFYIVVHGPTKVKSNTSSISTTVGVTRLVPAAGGGTALDDTTAGRFAAQDLTGATATLGNNIQNAFGTAGATTTTTDSLTKAVVAMPGTPQL